MSLRAQRIAKGTRSAAPRRHVELFAASVIQGPHRAAGRCARIAGSLLMVGAPAAHAVVVNLEAGARGLDLLA